LTILNFLINWFCITFISVMLGAAVCSIFGWTYDNNWLIGTVIFTGAGLFIFCKLLASEEFGIDYYLKEQNLRPAGELDRAYIYPMLDDLCSLFKIKRPAVFISSYKYPNASIIGSNTIIINEGLIHFASQDELKAILAHELGHLINKDGALLHFNVVLGKIGDILLVLCMTAALFLIKRFPILFPFALPFLFYALILRAVKFFVVLIIRIGNTFATQGAEYKADKYVGMAGLANAFISYGNKIMEYYPSERSRFRPFSTHPPWHKRIQRLATA